MDASTPQILHAILNFSFLSKNNHVLCLSFSLGGGVGRGGARVEPSFTKAPVPVASGSYGDTRRDQGHNRADAAANIRWGIKNTSHPKVVPTNFSVPLPSTLLAVGAVHSATEELTGTTRACADHYCVCESISRVNIPCLMCEDKTAS